MRKRSIPSWIIYLVVFFVGIILWQIFSPSPLPRKGRVIAVLDGDTIVLEGGWRVRYLGIDAPETKVFKDNRWQEVFQPQGEQAKRFNEKLVLGKVVRLEYDKVKKDRHNRLLAYVWVDDKMVGEELLRNGLAYTFFIYPNQKYWKRYVLAQIEAYETNVGLWRKPSVISPEEERKWNGVCRAVMGKVCKVISTGKAVLLFLKCDVSDRVVVVLPYVYFGSYGFDKYLNARGKSVLVVGKIKCNRNECKQVLFHPAQIIFVDQIKELLERQIS